MSINDPQWGSGRGNGDREPEGEREMPPRRPSPDREGPPDLEELWRDVNQRLSGLFGKRSNRGGPRPPSGGSPRPELSPKMLGGGASLLVGLLLALWLGSGFYTVDESQRSVVLTFGKYSETTGAGLHWRLPVPFQTHELVNLTGVRTVEVGYRGSERNKVLREALMLTDDENIINIQFAVQYFLKSPEDYLFNNRQPEESVLQVAETAIREVVGKNRMDFVLYEGREEIAAATHKLMQEILDRYQTGILVSKITMQNAQPPEQVQAAFDDAVKAGQDKERQKNEGQAYANDVIPKARGTAARLMAEAEGYKQRVIAQAEGDGSRFVAVLNEYAKAPEVTRQRMYIDTFQEIMSNTSKVMVDARASGNLLFLPLDKLMQAAGSPAGNPASPHPDSGGVGSPTARILEQAESAAARLRNSLHSREREGR